MYPQWSNLTKSDQDNLVSNVIWHLGKATNVDIKSKQLHIFAHVDLKLGQRIAEGINMTLT